MLAKDFVLEVSKGSDMLLANGDAAFFLFKPDVNSIASGQASSNGAKKGWALLTELDTVAAPAFVPYGEVVNFLASLA